MANGYEIAYTKIIPAFRKQVAKAMIGKYGLTQKEAATMLGKTQAAISKYVNGINGNMAIGEQDVSEFIEAAMAGTETDKRKILCRVCQKNREFDCAFVIR